ncbi:PHP domain-containing protein [Oceanospirillum maris]|uniref:PHP domain-containing protein n=1 Tax=Oceanospirillum maris TaxID=64977 RepID=UPI000425AF70|nr:PHP domain-containing protein [Oceanospirillum maris]
MNAYWSGFDLHSHSTCSDGRLTPEALVQLAASEGVHTLSLTDHDTVQGIPRAQVAAKEAGIDLIAGVEISTTWSGCNVHIVGLNLDIEHPVLMAGLKEQQLARRQRAEIIAEKLSHLGVEDFLAKVEAKANGAELGRPHFAQVLVDEGVVATMPEAFKKYLGAGKKGDVKSLWPTIETAVNWINAAGGIAVVAHPLHYKMTNMKRRALLKSFKDAGGQAMEVVSGAQQSRDQTNYMALLAKEYGLAASAGSDFHFPSQWQKPGKVNHLPETVQPVWLLWQDDNDAAKEKETKESITRM